MKQLRLRSGTTKTGVLAAATAFALLCVSASAFAAPYSPPGGPSASPEASVPTVFIKGGIHEKLHFVAPKTIVAGEDLKIQNTTNPHQVGPHTFSLVTKSSIPKTRKERQLCFTKGHICKAIAAWHGVKGNGPPSVNPAEAGAAGWDTLGSLTTKGDSWFTGSKPHASFEQPVSADTSAGPTTIYFMCAIHPWMHGSIEVLPGG